jgi:aspartate 1-decarboxylase
MVLTDAWIDKMLVYYPTDGNSYETYAVAGERSTGDFWIQGTAARQSTVGNRLEIMAFDVTDESKSPRIIRVDEYKRFV